MSVFTTINDTDLGSDGANAMPSVFDKNWQTTAAAAVAVATGGLGAGLLLGAFPAQTLAAGATVGGLAYAGHRREQGLSPLPFVGKNDEDKSSDESTAEAAA